MALRLRTADEWKNNFFEGIGITEDEVTTYCTAFVAQQLTEYSLPSLKPEHLTACGVTVLGHTLAILTKAQSLTSNTVITQTHDTSTVQQQPRENNAKSPPADPPKLRENMATSDWLKFKTDWTVYKRLCNTPTNLVTSRLYSVCEEALQRKLLHTVPNFETLQENELLSKIETIVTEQSTPCVHQLKFRRMTQDTPERIQDYVVRLKETAINCEFTCPNCQHDLTEHNVLEQFRQGIQSEHIQTELLAHVDELKTLEKTVKYAVTLEAASRDQVKLADPSEQQLARVYPKPQTNRRWNPRNKGKTQGYSPRDNAGRSMTNKKHCSHCGNTDHTPNERTTFPCPAYGTRCNYCKAQHHYASMCYRKKKDDNALALLDDTSGDQSHELNEILSFQSRPDINKHKTTYEIPAVVIPLWPTNRTHKPVEINVFPDSGAGACIAGPQHLNKLGLLQKDLIKQTRVFKVVGGTPLISIGWIPVTFNIYNYSTKQQLFIAQNVSRVYLSRVACIAVKILPECFPLPVLVSTAGSADGCDSHTTASSSTIPVTKFNQNTGICSTLLQGAKNDSMADNDDRVFPKRPPSIPFQPTQQNVDKLKKFLLDSFKSTTFNTDPPLPTLSGPPMHIHLKPKATPFARHTPNAVPHHLKGKIDQCLQKDITRDIIDPVPLGTPCIWCAPCVWTLKKNGDVRRTIDYRHLNSQCYRQTHHCPSPFYLASQIPPNTYRTVVDAKDGYHTVALDKDSQMLTAFITHQGRFISKRGAQGLNCTGDFYTCRYDEIIAHVPRKVKIVDDTALWDDTIEQCFWHTWEYLDLVGRNGIVLNPEKFVFCQKTIDFAGLTVNPHCLSPSAAMLDSIKNFPAPTDLKSARAWMGLVNQVSWAYSITDIMSPFRELVKPKAKFQWDATLQKLFDESKLKIIQAVHNGVQSFDTSLPTALHCDWSKSGIGYLLFQQHCKCSPERTNCCKDGWKIVYAGSRFLTPTESRYSPTEGEALALAWSLNHAKTYLIGCTNLTIVTDHKPLLGIFQNRDLGSIANPRIQRLKEKTLRFTFKVVHQAGQSHSAPDALSRYPTTTIASIYSTHPEEHPRDSDVMLCHSIEEDMEASALCAIDCLQNNSNKPSVITLKHLADVGQNDKAYLTLLKNVLQGFPSTKHDTDPSIKNFWNMKDNLSIYDHNIVMMNNRLVIPQPLRGHVLQTLHAAHQGCDGMNRRATPCVYWPGMSSSILNFRASCKNCSLNAPSQPREPLILTAPPTWPYQQVCADYFQLGKKSYLIIVDRYSGWPHIYYCPTTADSKHLVATCRQLFTDRGAPEEFASDGGPQFVSSTFQQFLSAWGIQHRLSAPGYPQSNGRAELTVKAMKKLVINNMLPDGSLNSDNMSRALLQYKNTPQKGTNLSPAQLLYHRNLKDFLPSHPSTLKPHPAWINLANAREKLLAERNKILAGKYDVGTRSLAPLSVGSKVLVQNQAAFKGKKWDRTGRMVEALGHRKYLVKMDGSGRVLIRNRRFLKFLPSNTDTQQPWIHLSPTKNENPIISVSNGTESDRDATIASRSPQGMRPTVCSEMPAPDNTVALAPTQSQVPRAVRNLADYNRPGLNEQPISGPRRPNSCITGTD